MVQAITYRNPHTGRYVAPAEVGDVNDPRDPVDGQRLEVSYDKMSKSKHNGVDPGAVIERYGADTARMFILFKAPPEKDLEWEDADVEGQFRFLQRIWRLVEGALARGLSLEGQSAEGDAAPAELTEAERELRRAVHIAIQEVSADLLGSLQCNTAVSELMKLANAMATHLEAVGVPVAREALRTLLLLLAPFAPHLAEELWQRLHGTPSDAPQTAAAPTREGTAFNSVHRQRWPLLDEAALRRDTIPLVIQVKG